MPEKDDNKPLYKPFKSKAKNKKYSVYVMKNGSKRLIHFGDSRYPQFRDRLGHYSSKDHRDPKRKKAYYARHGEETDKNTARYWAHRILWWCVVEKFYEKALIGTTPIPPSPIPDKRVCYDW